MMAGPFLWCRGSAAPARLGQACFQSQHLTAPGEVRSFWAKTSVPHLSGSFGEKHDTNSFWINSRDALGIAKQQSWHA